MQTVLEFMSPSMVPMLQGNLEQFPDEFIGTYNPYSEHVIQGVDALKSLSIVPAAHAVQERFHPAGVYDPLGHT